MENKDKKKSNSDLYVLIIIGIAVFWGLPSLIEGNGFFNGIVENFKALFYLIGLAIVVIAIYKITEK